MNKIPNQFDGIQTVLGVIIGIATLAALVYIPKTPRRASLIYQTGLDQGDDEAGLSGVINEFNKVMGSDLAIALKPIVKENMKARGLEL